jgi:hypothetical protein
MFHEFVLDQNDRAAHPLADLAVPGLEPKKIQRATRAGHVEPKSHGDTGISHWFMGSVAERVVRFPPCSSPEAVQPPAVI